MKFYALEAEVGAQKRDALPPRGLQIGTTKGGIYEPLTLSLGFCLIRRWHCVRKLSSRTRGHVEGGCAKGRDKAKTQAYCQIYSLAAAQARDEQNDMVAKKINDLQKQLGPEYLAFLDTLNNADQNSKDFQDILSMFDSLDKSCPH